MLHNWGECFWTAWDVPSDADRIWGSERITHHFGDYGSAEVIERRVEVPMARVVMAVLVTQALLGLLALEVYLAFAQSR